MNKFVLFLFAGALLAQDARKIVEESQKLHRSRSQQYEGVLEVYDTKGGKNEKRWQYARIGSYGESKSVLRFLAPPLVKGVALLVHNHPDRASDQWMWTPELNRDRRIALQDRSTRFFGTDFSFEDLEERDVDQSDYKLLGEEALSGQACYKIESVAKKSRTTQYSRVVIWVRKDILLPVQFEMYVKDEVVKRLIHRRVEKVQNVWSTLELEMNDLKKKTRTVMKTEKLKYDVALPEEQFTLQALRRGE
jgi:Outer membrane lipoprotein-sorting protein